MQNCNTGKKMHKFSVIHGCAGTQRSKVNMGQGPFSPWSMATASITLQECTSFGKGRKGRMHMPQMKPFSAFFWSIRVV
ncbi:hypothetical protein POVWA2_033510 [Plasmodium ovale wallikeri]|uniref:Uncharacterized protein n=1 Tax=Plasmodium ovale wallikeri TaxID=864142 RepID=A0A1A8Z0B3_PLAOA|nr:hypothetical protein POVWA1_034360 [Plasmodium ovale wallikeri]SBT37306.1 hypothetical protein POVWA2_033510 [Plasmodium ovale wallikeri]